jgi:hypothetical protein
MTLQELLVRHAQRSAHSVPDWMLGYFKRYSISFANGVTDLQTHVCWLQSRNFTIDLRLPLEAQQVAAKAMQDYTADELQVLANYEGWTTLSDWDGHTLSWRPTDTSLQLHNRWPEPAILKRIGNCMIEFCPSDAYVEDWRLQPSAPGPLIGLCLIEERDLASGLVRHKGGGLIVCGGYAALVLGRAQAEAIDSSLEAVPLKILVAGASDDPERLKSLFNFETSVAQGTLERGFSVELSTQPGRVGQSLFALDGFEFLPEQQLVRQQLVIEGTSCERIFSIDTLEPHVEFPQATAFTPASRVWFEQESPTLTRYTEALF